MSSYQLSLYRLTIPFRSSFKHASAERRQTESVCVAAVDPQGCVGMGEGCPRPYVTGENLLSVSRFFYRHCAGIEKTVRSPDELRQWTQTHRAEIDGAPAAWCAIELALWEYFARSAGQTVEQCLGIKPIVDTLCTSAVVGDGEEAAFRQVVEQYRNWNITRYKLKLSGKLEQDRQRLAHFVSYETVRVDANNFWRTPQQVCAHLKHCDRPLEGIEEPLQPGDYSGLRRVYEATGVPIILDESFTRSEQWGELSELSDSWIINLRLSKMGGLSRSLEVIEQAKSRAIRIVLGSQVGETSLLTRAGLAVATAAGEHLWAYEGAFSSHLLQVDPCVPAIPFGQGGQVDIKALRGPGFGMVLPLQAPIVQPLAETS